MKKVLLILVIILGFSLSIKANNEIRKTYLDSAINAKINQLHNDSLKLESTRQELSTLRHDLENLNQAKTKSSPLNQILTLFILGLTILGIWVFCYITSPSNTERSSSAFRGP